MCSKAFTAQWYIYVPLVLMLNKIFVLHVTCVCCGQYPESMRKLAKDIYICMYVCVCVCVYVCVCVKTCEDMCVCVYKLSQLGLRQMLSSGLWKTIIFKATAKSVSPNYGYFCYETRHIGLLYKSRQH